jgi:hypothetical protein
MQRYWYDSRAGIQWLAPRGRREKTLNVLRHEWLSFQQQHRLAQCAFVQPHRTRIPTNRFIVREDSCFVPARLTRNAESPLLNTPAADYTDLWICKREDRIINTREEHT